MSRSCCSRNAFGPLAPSLAARWYEGLGSTPLELGCLRRSTVDAARDLIGVLLAVRDPVGVLVGRIVETEAYTGPGDGASHAAKRRTGVVAAMWGEPGKAYIYTSYGLHSMLNVVAKEEGETGAVLIRAMEVVAGSGVIARRRPDVPFHRLASGPGLLCRAFGITSADYGADLIRGSRFALLAGGSPPRILIGERIGITRATDLPRRFFDADSRSVSAHRRGVPG